MITEDGIEADPDKVVKITNWPKPTNPYEVRQLLGFAGYYRKFVKDLARIAKPLFSLLPDTKKKETKKETSSKPWMWGSNQDTAFQTMANISSYTLMQAHIVMERCCIKNRMVRNVSSAMLVEV